MIKYCVILFGIMPFLGYSQKSDIGNWLMYIGNQKIHSKLNWHNEMQFRNYNAIADIQQIILRTGIGFNLTENNNTFLLGYAYIHSQNYQPNNLDKVKNNEHRLFQQFITRQSINRVNLQHRYRIEERFFSNYFQLRFRYLLGLNIPLNNKLMESKTIYASVYNEIFLNSQNQFFDRNRLYGAFGYCLNKNIRVEIGYMNQSLQNTSRNQFQITIFNNLSFHNK